jgi:hypothetical protein
MANEKDAGGRRSETGVAVIWNHYANVVSLKILGLNSEVQPQILRLTTPKLKSVWGPFRSG